MSGFKNQNQDSGKVWFLSKQTAAYVIWIRTITNLYSLVNSRSWCEQV